MPPNESEIAAKSLSKLWPHGMHESNYLKNLCCHLGLHRWSRLDRSALGFGERREFLTLVSESQDRPHDLRRLAVGFPRVMAPAAG